ncbi:sensor histidine kinase [Xylophilus sp. GW821-FHT01B05]
MPAPPPARRRWRYWRLTLLLLPWLLAMGIGFPLLWTQMDEVFQGPLRRARVETLEEAARALARAADGLRRDARFLSELAALDAGAGALRSGTDSARLMLAFARGASGYGRLHWMDADGRERLRVEQGTGAGPRLVPAAGLRDAGGDTEFDRASHLPAGDVYFSGFDLRRDAEGAAVQPPQPVLRVAAPVYDETTLRGVVVLELQAAELLDRLAAVGHAQHIDLYLVHQDGHWISGPGPAREGRGLLADTEPALWQAMQQRADGLFQQGEARWAFRRLDVARDPGVPSGQSGPQDDLKLRLLARVDPEAESEAGWRWKQPLAAAMAAVLAVALLLALQLARSMRAEARHTRELRAANRALTEANDNLHSMQADLTRAERLSSLGLMVAGVAHELNTPLGSATLALSTARQELDQLAQRLQQGLRRSDLEHYVQAGGAGLETVREAVRRAAALVQRFKQVAVDRASMQRRVFDLAQIVTDADPRLQHWPPDGRIALRLQLAPGLEMDSYPGPLEQVVSNLLENALLHAFEDRTRGCITLQALADGAEHVLLRFADDGSGIPEAQLPRIFDPFFTTRRHAGGTGLGLHIVHQTVVDLLGGTLHAENAPGGGAVFVLRLPRHAPQRAGD